MTADDLDPILLARYFNGEGDEADVQAVRRWIAVDPATRAVLVDRLREVWRISGEKPVEWDVEAALAVVRARGGTLAGAVAPHADLAERAPTLELLRPAAPRWRTMALRIAAGIVLAAGVGLAWHVSATADRPAVGELATHAFTTANAEQATILLADGTHVILGPASTLRVPERFSASSRHVSLDGEAYFAVAHDTLRPFTVASGIGLVRVHGTKFDVRARPESPGVTVVVSEGHVSLAARAAGHGTTTTGTPVMLSAGDLGWLLPGAAPRSVHDVDVDQYLGWITGRLTFVDAPLPEVLAELTRWYDVEFRLGDSTLAERHLTTSIERETLAQVLDVLEVSLDLRWSRTGRTITLDRLRP